MNSETIKPIRVGQVGVGGFGARRRKILRDSGCFELVAAYDLSEQALAVAEREDGAKPVPSFQALLDTPGLEAIVISTGAKFHAEQIIAAAERGYHVLVEKPLVSTPQELQDVLAAWRRSGVVIAVGHDDHRHNPGSQLIKQKIDSGELGTVATFEKTTCHAGGQQLTADAWRADPEKNPGGMLFQCGVHGIHELRYYFGPIVEVQAMFRSDVLPTPTDDVALCQLRFASGLVGTLNAYHCSPYRHTFSVFGTRSNLYRFNHFFHEGTELFQQVQESPDGHQPRQLIEVPQQQPGSHISGVRSFYPAIRDGAELYPSIVDGAQAVAVVFAATESAKTAQPVAVSNFEDPTGAMAAGSASG